MMEKEKNEKERKQAEEGKDVANYMTNQEEEELELDVDIDDKDQFASIVNSFYAGPTREDIDEEIKQALKEGMQLDSNNSFTYKTTTENEVLQSVGSAPLVGDDKDEAQILSDEGSQGSFITHRMARKS